MNWALQPSTYKNYPNSFEKFELDSQNSWHGIIYYVASISTKKYYPSFRFGEAGFVMVVDEHHLIYPEYKGNGLMASMGNMTENPNIGLPFID